MQDKAQLMQIVDGNFMQMWLLRSEGLYVSGDWIRSKNRLLGQLSADQASVESDKLVISSTKQQGELQIMRT